MRNPRRVAVLTASCATALVGGYVAAPAMSLEPYHPDPVEFELDSPSATPMSGPSPAVISPAIKAPKRFNIVGLRWAGRQAPEVELRVRRTGDAWSNWTHVEPSDGAPDPSTREARRPAAGTTTDPVWAGEADEVQYKLPRRLPDVDLEFVNTTGSATRIDRARTAARETANRGLSAVAALAAPDAGAAAGRPTIVPRSAWGGDDCAPREAPAGGRVRMAFVHHTVTANGYSRSQARAMVLGICRYHRNTNGWSDIGYNFLVDRYGTLYEGRAGGARRAVVGAHAQGFNAQSVGIANLGTHGSTRQNRAALYATRRLLRWKFDLHGTPRSGRASVTSSGGASNRYVVGRRVVLPRISGHRDGNLTTCPGGALYAQLPLLRRLVGPSLRTSATTARSRASTLTDEGTSARTSATRRTTASAAPASTTGSRPRARAARTYAFGQRTLRRGHRGRDVRTLQTYVTRLGYATPVSSSFSWRTQTDIRRYEGMTGLRADGVVRPVEARTIARRAAARASRGFAAPLAPALPTSTHVFPIQGPHSYGGGFGQDRGTHLHGGQDMPAAAGTPLVAVTSGRVSHRRYQAGGAGHYVVIQGNDGTDYVYMHMQAAAVVVPGQTLSTGQLVGRVGSTGGSSGPHLHFEAWTAHWYAGGSRFNPMDRLRYWDSYS